jgi:hypothetical protein
MEGDGGAREVEAYRGDDAPKVPLFLVAGLPLVGVSGLLAFLHDEVSAAAARLVGEDEPCVGDPSPDSRSKLLPICLHDSTWGECWALGRSRAWVSSRILGRSNRSCGSRLHYLKIKIINDKKIKNHFFFLTRFVVFDGLKAALYRVGVSPDASSEADLWVGRGRG